jgi:hypothetical protein
VTIATLSERIAICTAFRRGESWWGETARDLASVTAAMPVH